MSRSEAAGRLGHAMQAPRAIWLWLVALVVVGCGEASNDPSNGPAQVPCDADAACDGSSTATPVPHGSTGAAASEGAGDDSGSTTIADADGTAENGSTTTGGRGGHPDGLDPWLPDLDPDQCAVEYPWIDAIAVEDLTPRTVCRAGCDHATLAEALAGAEPNDEILLEPGEYDECVTVEVSPLVIRGNEGMARFTAPACDAPQIFRLNGAHVRMSSIEISQFDGRGIQFGAGVEQAVLERLRLDGLDYAIAGAPQELLLRQLKVTNSGYYDEGLQHAGAIVASSPSHALVVDRSVFSHYRNRAWLFGVHDTPHFEMVCSVIAKVAGPENEADHSLHLYFPGDILLHDNFIQTASRIYHYMYNNGGPPANLVMARNEFVFDDPAGDYVGNIQSSTVVSAVDNVVVGGIGDDSLAGWSLGDVSGNAHVVDRAAAGYDPFPALPSSWPVSDL